MSIATQEQTVVDRVEKRLYIGGEWRDAGGGETLAVEDPSTGEPLCEVADATPEDARAALDAAVASQPEWAATPPNERGEILWRAFETLNERADELGAADDPRDGQGRGGVEGGDRLCGRVLPLVLGRGPADRRQLQDRRQRAPAGCS